MRLSRRTSVLALLAGLIASSAYAAEKLPSFKGDINQTSVSGLSSGAFMAAQLQVAYSATITGAGIVAGGPYYCAAGLIANTSICMGQVPFVAPNPALMVSAAQGFAALGQIDSLDNLKNDKVYIFSGTDDSVVKQVAVDATASFFAYAGVPAENLLYVKTVPAGHAFITPSFGNDCSANAGPYISHCIKDGTGYDQAGAILQHIYGTLKAPATTLSGKIVEFDQRPFAPAISSMAPTGYLYVPKSCADGAACKVHVAIHGCLQSAAAVGDDVYSRTGYNNWADSNDIVVLYPQVNVSYTIPFNPQGCWDWWGYTGSNYALKSGVQMEAIWTMVQTLVAKP